MRGTGVAELAEETSTYALRRDEAGPLKLQMTIMHGAADATG